MGLGGCTPSAHALTHSPWLIRSPDGCGPAGRAKSLANKPSRVRPTPRCPGQDGGRANILAGETQQPCSWASPGLSDHRFACVLPSGHGPLPCLRPRSAFPGSRVTVRVAAGPSGEPERAGGRCETLGASRHLHDLRCCWSSVMAALPILRCFTTSSKEQSVFWEVEHLVHPPSSLQTGWRWSVRSGLGGWEQPGGRPPRGPLAC